VEVDYGNDGDDDESLDGDDDLGDLAAPSVHQNSDGSREEEDALAGPLLSPKLSTVTRMMEMTMLPDEDEDDNCEKDVEDDASSCPEGYYYHFVYPITTSLRLFQSHFSHVDPSSGVRNRESCHLSGLENTEDVRRMAADFDSDKG